MGYGFPSMVWPLLLSLALAAPGSRAAQTLSEATALRDKRQLAEAYDAAQRALKAGDATEKQTWAIHALLAELAAAMDYADAATTEFARTLELNPAYELSALASPKLALPFKKAKEQLAGAALAATVTTKVAPDGAWLTEVTVTGDANRLVRAGALLQRGPEGVARRGLAAVTTENTGALQAAWSCAQPRCEYDVVLLDESGNELWRAGSDDAPLTVFAPGAVAPVAALTPSTEAGAPVAAVDTRAWYARPLPWAIGASALAIVGAVLMSLTLHDAGELRDALAHPSLHLYADVQALESSAQTKRAAMFGAYGGALALAGVMAFQF